MRNIKKSLLLYDNHQLTNLKKLLNWTLVISYVDLQYLGINPLLRRFIGHFRGHRIRYP